MAGCVVCQKLVELMRHDFFEGTPERPVRKWSVMASLYFLAYKDGLTVEHNFCGPACATAFFASRFVSSAPQGEDRESRSPRPVG